MPAKFKESENRVVNRRKVGMQHFYLRNTSTDDLLEALEKDSTKPKHKHKYRNELIKRGVLSA
ncbi:MAG: hypothetical protein NZ811_03280 [Gammaproteobacteria bacterium]|nr:hypothetical protein [Gammaproteobacteria bacterium]